MRSTNVHILIIRHSLLGHLGSSSRTIHLLWDSLRAIRPSRRSLSPASASVSSSNHHRLQLQDFVFLKFHFIGILNLQPTSQPKTKAAGLSRHQLIILGIGLPSIVTGTTLIYANKTIHEAPHFTTWHGVRCFFGSLSFIEIVRPF